MENFKEGVDAGQACPDCGKPLVGEVGPLRKFLACSAYPDCKFTKDLSGRERPADEPTDEICPTCGKPMVISTAASGSSSPCSGYPECKTTKPITARHPLSPGRRPAGGAAQQARQDVLRLRELPPVHLLGMVAAGVPALSPVRSAVRHRARWGAGARSRALRQGRLRLQGRRRPHGRLKDRPTMPHREPPSPRPDDSPVSAFLQYLPASGAPLLTPLRGYAADLAEFRRFLRVAKVGGWEAVDARALRGYLAWLHGRGSRGPPSRASWRRSGAASASSPGGARSRRIRRAMCARRAWAGVCPPFLPKDESKDLLDAAFEDTDAGRRDRALLELLYACGLLAECCGLDLEDVDRRHGRSACSARAIASA